MKTIYITYEKIHKIIEGIAKNIKKDKWNPDCIVAIAAGGLIPSRILRNFLKKDIYVVGLKRYADENTIHIKPIKIQWIDEVENKLTNKKILLVDEVDDTRITLSYCLKELLSHSPKEIRVAVLHQKKKKKKADYPKEINIIYQGEEAPDIWIKYPWDALDIDKHNELCNINIER